MQNCVVEPLTGFHQYPVQDFLGELEVKLNDPVPFPGI